MVGGAGLTATVTFFSDLLPTPSVAVTLTFSYNPIFEGVPVKSVDIEPSLFFTTPPCVKTLLKLVVEPSKLVPVDLLAS